MSPPAPPTGGAASAFDPQPIAPVGKATAVDPAPATPVGSALDLNPDPAPLAPSGGHAEEQ